MAAMECEYVYNNDGSNGNHSDQEHNEKPSNDVESSPSNGSMNKKDPFGDEKNSEIKYRTLAWWLVASFRVHDYSPLIGCLQASRNEYIILSQNRWRAQFAKCP